MTTGTGEVGQVFADVSYRSLFRQQRFPQLAIGTVLARTAGQLWQIALVLYILERFHSPALAGFATFLAVVPGLIISPLAGALLDRHGRLRLILVDYAIAATALTLITALAAVHALSSGLLLAIVAVSSLTGPLSASGTRALFPSVVPRELWDRANAVDSASMALASIAGPLLAGFCVAWFSQGAFLGAALVFIAAGLVVLNVREPPAERSPQRPLLLDAWQALAYVVRHRSLRGIIFTLWMINVPFGIIVVALPALVLRALHWGPATVGELWAVSGIATVIAGTLVGRLNSEGRERQIIAGGIALSALACLLIALQAPLALIIAMVLIGLSSGPLNIGLFALRQRRTDPRWFGRVFAVSMSLNFLGEPVGAAAGGPLAQQSFLLAFVIAAAIGLAGCVVPFLTIPADG